MLPPWCCYECWRNGKEENKRNLLDVELKWKNLSATPYGMLCDETMIIQYRGMCEVFSGVATRI